MAWTEVVAQRGIGSRTYQDAENPRRRIYEGQTGARWHYDAADTVDMTPVRVDNAALDGWIITGAPWHYALGKPADKATDGWVGFGGRQGAHWLKFRLARIGYLHWPERVWRDLGGAPTYNRANLTPSYQVTTVGPNDDEIVTQSDFRWADLWPLLPSGQIDAHWRSDGNRLKEEIVVNRAARAWIRTYRAPTTPLDETWFAQIYQVDWSDIPQRYIDGLLVSVDDDSSTDGVVELRDAEDALLALLPIDYVYVRDPETGEVLAREPLRRRLWLEDGNHYLLVGVRCDVLAGLPDGDLVFDPTVDTQVGASADDAWAVHDTAIPGGGTAAEVLYLYSESTLCRDSGFRFTLTGPGSGDTINTAYFEYYAQSSYDDPYFKLYAEAVDDASQYADSGALGTRSKTTAYAQFDFTNTGLDTWVGSSVEIKSVIQEVIDRVGWASGQHINLIAYGDPAQSGRYARAMSYDGSTTYAAKLHVEYTAGGVAPVAVALDALMLAGTVPSPIISPGPVTIALNALALTGIIQDASVSPGAIAIVLDALLLSATANAAQISPGAISVVLDALMLTGTAKQSSISPGAVSIVLNALTLAATPEGISVTPGAVATMLDTLSLTSSAHTLTASPGVVAIALDVLTLTGSVHSLSITNALRVALGVISLSATAKYAGVTPGAVAIALDKLTLTATPVSADILAQVWADAALADSAVTVLTLGDMAVTRLITSDSIIYVLTTNDSTV